MYVHMTLQSDDYTFSPEEASGLENLSLLGNHRWPCPLHQCFFLCCGKCDRWLGSRAIRRGWLRTDHSTWFSNTFTITWKRHHLSISLSSFFFSLIEIDVHWMSPEIAIKGKKRAKVVSIAKSWPTGPRTMMCDKYNLVLLLKRTFLNETCLFYFSFPFHLTFTHFLYWCSADYQRISWARSLCISV